MALEESRNSYYLYCLGYDGLWSVKIPNFNQLDKHHKPELKMGCVFTCDPNLLPIHNGLFSSGRNVYMVGGKDYQPILHVLDPTSFEKFPVEDPQFLYKPMKLPSTKFKPLVSPIVIHANGQVYFLTQYISPWFCKYIKGFRFQSFDPDKNQFHSHPSPYKLKAGHRKPYGRDMGTNFQVAAHFAAFDYIHVFIQELKSDPFDFTRAFSFDFTRAFSFDFTRAFSFNTRSSEWEDTELMAGEFRKNRIPIPLLHRGDTGVSQGFPGQTWILVALCNNTPIAYRVTVSQHGHLRPKSYRFLEEIKSRERLGMVQLHDIGSGRFCSTYESFYTPLNVFIFEIDFAAEYEIQISPEVSGARTSSKLLCSMTFSDNDPSNDIPSSSFYAFCLAAAPASQSPGNQIAAAEEQDRDGKMDKATCKRKRYWEEENKVKEKN